MYLITWTSVFWFASTSLGSLNCLLSAIYHWNCLYNLCRRVFCVEHHFKPLSGSWIVQSGAGCFDDGVISLGCVIKTSNVDISIVAFKRLTSFADASTIELLGIMWAMQLARELKLDNVIFRSDAMVIVDCINANSFCCYSSFGTPLYIKKKNLSGEFSSTTLLHFNRRTLLYLNRSSNAIADHMVEMGKSLYSKTWIGHIPLLEDNSISMAVVTPF